MTREQLFEAWAPSESPWSAWAKPVLFATILDPEGRTVPPVEPLAVPGARPASPPTAVVLDLPGAESVRAALGLAAVGFRPVPLFNTCPGVQELVSVDAIVLALLGGVGAFAGARLRADAPPAFMIDSLRLAPGAMRSPGRFDNRWIVFPQDFPSGSVLASRGISRALVVRSDAAEPGDDLRRVLAGWKRAGIAIELLDARSGTAPRPFDPGSFPSWQSWVALVLVSLGLRRSAAGGFGVKIPEQSSGGGWA